jgi:hypothetical protein
MAKNGRLSHMAELKRSSFVLMIYEDVTFMLFQAMGEFYVAAFY